MSFFGLDGRWRKAEGSAASSGTLAGGMGGGQAGGRFLVPGAWPANSKRRRKQGTAPTTEEIFMIFRPWALCTRAWKPSLGPVSAAFLSKQTKPPPQGTVPPSVSRPWLLPSYLKRLLGPSATALKHESERRKSYRKLMYFLT